MGEKVDDNKTPAYMFLPFIKHQLSLSKFQDDVNLKNKFIEIIKQNNMSSYYEKSCNDLNWNFDKELNDSLKNDNLKMWISLKSSDTNWNESETIENLQDELELSLKTGETNKVIEIANKIIKNPLYIETAWLDAGFNLFRVGFIEMNMLLMKQSIRILKKLIESDYLNKNTNFYYKNKLKAYEGVCRISRGNFDKSANLLLDCLSTFESYELIEYKKIIEYMTIAGTMSWSRTEIKKNMIDNGQFMESLHLEDPSLVNFFTSFYNCQYDLFFNSLNLIVQRIQNDPLLAPHCKFYIKEIKIRSYSQLLKAYSSLTFKKISDEFLIPVDVVEYEISKFIKKKKINCQIDGVLQCVINSCTGVDSSMSSSVCHRSKLYKDIIKNGDILMNRLQILSTIIDI